MFYIFLKIKIIFYFIFLKKNNLKPIFTYFLKNKNKKSAVGKKKKIHVLLLINIFKIVKFIFGTLVVFILKRNYNSASFFK